MQARAQKDTQTIRMIIAVVAEEASEQEAREEHNIVP
jgi:hypothetical protein